MADTSELLRLCDELLENPLSWADAKTVARALKSRLQAEAPEDAEVDEEHPLVEHVARAIAVNGVGRPWDDFAAVNAHDMDHGDLKQYALAAIRAIPRTSQAEAQALPVTREELKNVIAMADTSEPTYGTREYFLDTHGWDLASDLDATLAYAKSRLQAEAPTISDAHVHCPACGQHVHFTFDAPITQRARAEAPEDAEALREVMLALEDLSFECFSPIAPCSPPSVATYSRTFDVLDKHRKARGWATVPKAAVSKSRTSQAEAQAPASVLTGYEEGILAHARRVYEARNSAHGIDESSDVFRFALLIDRLTVGAPGPAPTIDDDAIARALVVARYSYPITPDEMRAILMAAKGGTS